MTLFRNLTPMNYIQLIAEDIKHINYFWEHFKDHKKPFYMFPGYFIGGVVYSLKDINQQLDNKDYTSDASYVIVVNMDDRKYTSYVRFEDENGESKIIQNRIK